MQQSTRDLIIVSGDLKLDDVRWINSMKYKLILDRF